MTAVLLHLNLPRYLSKDGGKLNLNNLFGVDIMEEAVEICKLRLFLKLAAQVEPDPAKDNLGIEPLPDIDFNIRAGNTLVGFTSMDEIRRALDSDLVKQLELPAIEEKAADADRAFNLFRQMQTNHGMDAKDFVDAKRQLRDRLHALETELNRYLASEYGIVDAASRRVGTSRDGSSTYHSWLKSHQPFHWFVEFYGIVNSGGFDVIIGNPPYVEYEAVSDTYRLRGYVTLPTGNLYALVIERCSGLVGHRGRFGMIVPASASCTEGYIPLQTVLLEKNGLHISSYSDQRGKLFDIPHPRLCIIIFKQEKNSGDVFVTPYMKLGRDQMRTTLFQRLNYTNVGKLVRPGVLPRYGSVIEASIHKQVFRQTRLLGSYVSKHGMGKVYYTRKLSWFVQVTPFVPTIFDKNGIKREPSELKTLLFDDAAWAKIAFAALNSNLFYWFIVVGSDCRNLNMREVLGLPLNMDTMKQATHSEMDDFASRLFKSLVANSELRTMAFSGLGTIKVQCLFPGKSKPIIDEIDQVLARHYGFTEEELDFIINYDIKYRMGRDD